MAEDWAAHSGHGADGLHDGDVGIVATLDDAMVGLDPLDGIAEAVDVEPLPALSAVPLHTLIWAIPGLTDAVERRIIL